MDPFSYLSVLTSIVLALGITRLLTVLLMPDPFEEGFDSKQHFYNNHRWFFTLTALLPLIDAIDTWLKGAAHFIAQGPVYILTILLLFALNVVAAFNRREGFNAFFAVFFLVYILVFITINLRVLG